jgi:hypothetical protein
VALLNVARTSATPQIVAISEAMEVLSAGRDQLSLGADSGETGLQLPVPLFADDAC